MSRPVAVDMAIDQANNTWRLIRTGFCSGAWNMALDQALLEAVAEGASGPILRLYRWRPATVTLGYAQRGQGVVNLEACQRRGFDVVRRCTGGRAVLHDREVTYAVIAPTGDGLFPHSVLASYRLIAEALADVYRGLGLEVILADQRHPGVHDDAAGRSACFTAPGQYELLYRGCKLAGCAQKRIPGAFLQHGSLPVDLDLEALYDALDTE
ncbi:MAG: lipoate--protein ligase family protein, partial [Deltaproteobacteria bacterium]